MRTPEEVLAQLGITPGDTGPYSYADLLATAAHALKLETSYRENLMRAVRPRPAPEPEMYSDEWVRQEQAKGYAWLMSPAKLADDNDLSAFAGMNVRIMPYDPNEEQPPF